MSKEEIDELIFYIADFKRNFNQKLNDNLYIIQQQNKRIDEQNCVIEELAWQLRDLRGSVRQLSLNNNNNLCVCNYENHIPTTTKIKDGEKIEKNLETLDKSEFNESENHYETVEYSLTKGIQKNTDKNVSLPIKFNAKRYGKIDGRPKTDNISSNCKQEDATVSLKNVKEEIFETTLIDNDDEFYDDVVLRTRKFKIFARNSQRGSSKNATSLISDIEEEY